MGPPLKEGNWYPFSYIYFTREVAVMLASSGNASAFSCTGIGSLSSFEKLNYLPLLPVEHSILN